MSLISWLSESLETELSAFHHWNFFFFFFLTVACDEVYGVTYYISSGIFTYPHALLVSSPGNATYVQRSHLMAW